MAQVLRKIDEEAYVQYGTFALEGTDLDDRQIVAKDLATRQIFVSGIVTILRRDNERSMAGGQNWYVVRDAESHEAARVLGAEARWKDAPERRRGFRVRHLFPGRTHDCRR